MKPPFKVDQKEKYGNAAIAVFLQRWIEMENDIRIEFAHFHELDLKIHSSIVSEIDFKKSFKLIIDFYKSIDSKFHEESESKKQQKLLTKCFDDVMFLYKYRNIFCHEYRFYNEKDDSFIFHRLRPNNPLSEGALKLHSSEVWELAEKVSTLRIKLKIILDSTKNVVQMSELSNDIDTWRSAFERNPSDEIQRIMMGLFKEYVYLMDENGRLNKMLENGTKKAKI